MTSIESPNTFESLDDRWSAVVRRDCNGDGLFVYAVTTTSIFCRPSCAARKPNRSNVQFFRSVPEAISAGFRPCKRCRPQQLDPDQHLKSIITNACEVIEANQDLPDLQSLAESVGLSRFHFHRLFHSALGVTPMDYARMKRDERMRLALRSESSVTDAIYEAGFNSSSRFYSQSSKSLGMTPKSYRSGGKGEDIRFALGQCSLGHILIAATAVGICSISLGDDVDKLLDELQSQFDEANLIGDDEGFAHHVAAVVAFVESPASPLELPLDIRGTAFQRRVWNALQKTKPGETLSYAELAQRIGSPKAVRAVANACGSNSIALAIPCHRVVRIDGTPSGYRWGIERKHELLQRELAHETSR